MPINQFSNVMYSWAPAGTSKANTFTAQNIFKAATTTDPAAIFQSTGTISAIPTMDANAIAMFQGTEGTTSHVFFSSAASNAHFVFRRRQGTYASPTAVQTNNVLGAVQWQGYGASTFGSVPAAEIRAYAQQAFTETARGTAMAFYVTANNTITQQLTLTIFPTVVAATVDVQSTGYNLTKTAGNSRIVQFQTSSSNRWALIANATAEGGSNAGSDFEIRRYSDAAADLGLVMAVTRSTGNITFNGGGGITSFAANKIQITTAQTPATSAAAGNAGDIAWDDTYLYVRMSTGWRRIALGAAF